VPAAAADGLGGAAEEVTPVSTTAVPEQGKQLTANCS